MWTLIVPWVIDGTRAMTNTTTSTETKITRRHPGNEYIGICCAWETTLLFNNQQAMAFKPRVYWGVGIRDVKKRFIRRFSYKRSVSPKNLDSNSLRRDFE